MSERPVLIHSSSLTGTDRERFDVLTADYEVVWLTRAAEPGETLDADQIRRATVVSGHLHGSLIDFLLDAGAPLRYLQAWSAGVNALPLDRLAAADVALCSASGVHAESISEVILLSMLAFARQLPTMFRSQLAGVWERPDGQPGIIHHRTVGILGVGAIGTELARLCQAFRMTVLGLRRSMEPAEHVDELLPPEAVETLYQRSDYVVNILPDTEATQTFVDAAAFAAMQPHAVYINVGRGVTTDTDALYAALQAGRIAGAALDVVDPEPLPPEHPLWTLENVLIMPHMSGSTPDYDARALDILTENLAALAAGEEPRRARVDYDAGY